ncbi:hypothetical protein PT015_23120 [Candidatus Mycobacterium wuenschmannii]|uniref:Secreted protein n=1 Tax=Candidatus Mycobacterium wuenschmannii TaxID=3027808 RepID=A0ABY8VX72_9MYCO|nr:hypothetical protein [Candidatus Mycobacterium wuenschmannii]WIM87686.1 hypothetical protein PT015_23120 [Candidatus Mycobacterium wuenschmannii]
MNSWIRRNGRAIVISVLVVGLIGITVTLPAWRENIGYRLPKHVVPYGSSIVIGNTRWQLSPVTAPSVQELRKKRGFLPDDPYDIPPDGRLATYLLRRTKNGKPVGVPDGYPACTAAVNSGDRQWTRASFSLGVTEWEINGGVSAICSPRHTEPLLVAIIVPKDVTLTSVDVQFLPESWDNKKQMSKATDLLVIRFNTG